MTEKNKAAALNVEGPLGNAICLALETSELPSLLRIRVTAELKVVSPLEGCGGVLYPWGKRPNGLSQDPTRQSEEFQMADVEQPAAPQPLCCQLLPTV